MLGEAVGVALVAAFSPWALLIVDFLLSQSRPKRLALVFLATATSITLAVGFAVVLALNSSGIDDTRKHRTVPAALDLASAWSSWGSRCSSRAAHHTPRESDYARRGCSAPSLWER